MKMEIIRDVLLIASIIVSYCAGVSSGMKDVDIARLETERDMYKKRLAEWKAEDNR